MSKQDKKSEVKIGIEADKNAPGESITADKNNAAETKSKNSPEKMNETGKIPETEAAELTQEEKIAELEARLAENHDLLLRKAAEFENFRKRMNQEKQGAIEYANQSLILDIIPVIDDFERAIQAGEKGLQGSGLQTSGSQTSCSQASGSQASGLQAINAEYSGFLEGIKMIEKRLTSQLESKWGLKRFSSAGELFDPNLHEALMMEKSPDVSEATVLEDYYKGYFLKDRVIRAAKVKVLMPE